MRTESYEDAPRLQRVARAAGTLRPLSRVYARVLHRVDRWVFARTGGRTTLTSLLTGLPVIMLTTTGARSGLPRTVPVLAQPEGEDLIVVASSFGQRRHPAWYRNLRADPHAAIVIDGTRRDVVAEELVGEEREHYYRRGFKIYPGWRQYRGWAGEREIPVLRLRSRGGP